MELPRAQEIANLILLYQKNPKLYFSDVLGINQTWDMQDLLMDACPRAIQEHKQIYVASGHSIGKDYICSGLALWFLDCYIPSKVILTAPTDRQVKKIMWGECLEKWNKKLVKFQGKAFVTPYIEITEENHFLIGFTTKETGASADSTGGKFQGFHCFSEDTEILTQGGYKTIDEMDINDKVLSVKVGKIEAEWKPITNIYKYPYDGYLNVIDNRKVSFAVTDEHRFPTKYTTKTKEWSLKKFSELKYQFVVQNIISWKGKEFAVPNEFKGMSSEEYAEFIGFWTGDGGVRQHYKTKRFYEVILYQKKESNLEYVIGLFKGRKIYKGKDYYCLSDRRIAEWLIKNVGRYGKDRIIPRDILDATPSIINAYLRGMWMAEGSLREDGTFGQVYNTSKVLMDGIQEMLLKIGKPSSLGINKMVGSGITRNTCYVLTYVQDHKDTIIKKDKVKRERYQGRVWCIETENETFVARRNGKCFVSGNSPSVCVIVSEAQAVEDSIYDQIDAITTSENCLVVFIGNPTRAKGRFAAGLRDNKRNITFNFSCLDNPNYKARRTIIPGLASYEWVEDKRIKWGEGDPRWVGRVLGQIPDVAINNTFPASLIMHMKGRYGFLARHGDNPGVAVDPSGEGIDENVFIAGNAGEPLNVFTKTIMSPVEVALKAIEMCKQVNGKFIIIDCDGIGIGPYQELMRLPDDYTKGIQIIKFHGSAPSALSDAGASGSDEKARKIYANMRAEAAFVARDRGYAGRAAVNEFDTELLEDLQEEEYFTNNTGKIQIEPKEDLKERLGRSPGRGDAWKMLQWAFDQNFEDKTGYRSEDSRLPRYAMTDEVDENASMPRYAVAG